MFPLDRTTHQEAAPDGRSGSAYSRYLLPFLCLLFRDFVIRFVFTVCDIRYIFSVSIGVGKLSIG